MFVFTIIFACYGPIILTLNVFTMLYFVQMARNFLNILSRIHDIKRARTLGIITLMVLWTTVTLTFSYVFETLFYVIEKAKGNDLYFLYPEYTVYQRVLFYLSKPVPFVVTIFMIHVIVFFLKDKQGNDDNLVRSGMQQPSSQVESNDFDD